MRYITVYTTTDKSEVSVLKSLFEKSKIDFQLQEEKPPPAGERPIPEKRFQVNEKDREKAREILHETGYLRVQTHQNQSTSRKPMKRWIFLFLAALILVLVILLITWFMNPDI
ncbi:putative signal transducing protein [Salinimicrobium soli]|uniref:putative signal transducing protein n=1 Tax=Salinimicrobium soli TaxID=1254399 RepID=UPI003AADB03A